ncbi:MAG: outer membrane lipoprotein-sorting protein [Bacteroidota bacterium]|nr:outer membrane lipoprotein-sorting protein [Bacteroidota bacterium]
MRPKIMITRFLFLLLYGSICVPVPAQNLTASEIIKKADEKARGLSARGTMTLSVIRPDWTKSITFKTWSKGTEFSLIYITAPAREKGQVFLKRHKDMWNWVPTIERMIKIPPSMMMQSWMGSDFTNDDLVKESSLVVDYTHKLLGRETVRGMECYKLELTPLPDAAVTWGKIITWITVKGLDQWKAEYFDEDMALINSMNASQIKRMGDRELPTLLEIVPANKKGNKTVLEINQMVFNQPIAESFFSQQNMKTIK